MRAFLNNATPKRVYRLGEILFFVLIFFYFSSGFPFLPESWAAYLSSHAKLHRKLLTFAAGIAVILGVLLFEWSQRNRGIKSESILNRIAKSLTAREPIWILTLFAGFGFWWTLSSWLRVTSLGAGFDMAIFTQAVWNTAQGNWFYSSIKGGINLLGDHFGPLLAILAAPYKLWPSPTLILITQAFSVASCIFPITRIVRHTGQSRAWAVLFCIAFVLYHPVRNAVRFEFHPEVFAMPLFFWAFLFLERGKSLAASGFLFCALLTKENIATVAFGFGIYACLAQKKHWKFGIFWMIFSVLYFFIVTNQIIPAFSGQPYAYLEGNFTAWLKEGWGPFLKHLGQSSTFSYLWEIFGPLAFTSVLAPTQAVLVLPTLAQNLFSRNEMTRDIYYQYTATLTPFVFIAAVYGMAKIRRYRRFWAYGILILSVLLSGVSETYTLWRFEIQKTPHVKRVGEILAAIPSSCSLRTHERYATTAANRKELHIYENNHPREGGSWKAMHADLVAIDRRMLEDKFDTAISQLKAAGFYVIFEEDGFVILSPNPRLALPIQPKTESH